MSRYKLIRCYSPSKSWLLLGLILIVLGLFFRVTHLGDKVYWVDEVATSIRVAGYTKQAVIERVSEGIRLNSESLQQYQRLSPDRGWPDTLNALTQSPEHSPLYFLLARGWTQQFGSSVVAIRSLSVVVSLLALPCLYWLCWELFGSVAIGWLAVGLLSVSPFFVAYAQEARPYSLWSVTLLFSGVSLLRALRLNDRLSWSLYAVSLAIGLYTSLLTGLVIVGHAVYVIGIESFRIVWRRYLVALSCSAIAFIPWLWVIIRHWHNLERNTTWMRSAMNPLAMAAIWLYSLVVVFFDLPVSTTLSPSTIAKFLMALAVLILIVFSLYWLCARTPKQVWLFVLAFSFSTPLFLVLVDLISGGQASATSRYLIPAQLGILIAIVYGLGHSFDFPASPSNQQRQWKIVAAILFSISLLSCVSNLERSPNYLKDRNRSNPAIAAIVNRTNFPLLLAESREVIDLLSLSYNLDKKVQIQILNPAHLLTKFDRCQNTFWFNPSESVKNMMDSNSQLIFREVYQPPLLTPNDSHLSLWKITLSNRVMRTGDR